MTSDNTVVFATFSGRKGTAKKQSVQYLKMGVLDIAHFGNPSL
jgi:hypothetical protein